VSFSGESQAWSKYNPNAEFQTLPLGSLDNFAVGKLLTAAPGPGPSAFPSAPTNEDKCQEKVNEGIGPKFA